MKYVINIIGAGKLGSTCGYLLAKSGIVDIGGICNSTLETSERAVQFMGQGFACSSLDNLPPADIYFITTPDYLIKTICDEIVAKNKAIKKDAIFLHCSGALNSDIFELAKKSNYFVASVHPIKSFANPAQNINDFSGTYCTYEGDERACEIIMELFSAIGGILLPINKHEKILYHVGCVFSANYLVTLFDIAARCYIAAGISEQNSYAIVKKMITSTLNNLNELNPKQALTGPIVRGEKEVIERHIQALQQTDFLDVYKILGDATLKLVE